MNPQGLLGKERAPAGGEVVVPPAGGVVRCRGRNCHAPAKVMGRIHARGERLVHVGRVQPPGDLGVLLDATFQALGEAQQGVSAGVATAGGEGLLVVDLPEQQKCHSRFADGGICWTKEAVMTNPIRQSRIHLPHCCVPPGRWKRVTLELFHSTAPCTYINAMTRCTIPAD